ncbi:ABC transporter permease [Georgenia wangjunii]|uniref:ABC transporter permease n=1 Tax=Georgenia wangjunii TaxID=3117730 RepID=UPI002F26D090
MTTLTATRSPRGLGALTAAEARLFLRDAGGSFFALAFPSILLVGIGFAIPGMRERITDLAEPWAGMLPIHIFTPVVLATAIATPALTTLPVFLATYREQGILRRLSTTPMRPQGVLVAQVAVNIAALAAAAVLALVIAAVVFGSPAPEQPAVAVLAFLLGAAAMFGVGLLIAARAPKGSAASGLGMLVYFPMLLFAGMWTPGPMMPETLATIGSYTPLGAASQAMTAAWFSDGFPALQVVVMLGYVAVLYPLAAKLFRWS